MRLLGGSCYASPTWIGKFVSSRTIQLAFELKCSWHSGFTGNSLSKAPAGKTAKSPFLDSRGRGLPHREQNDVAKLDAEGRSYRLSFSSPFFHFSWSGLVISTDDLPEPVALRQRLH